MHILNHLNKVKFDCVLTFPIEVNSKSIGSWELCLDLGPKWTFEFPLQTPSTLESLFSLEKLWWVYFLT
jgi:hypothetical protein